MNEEAVNAAVAVIEWMNKNEPECCNGGGDNRINALGKFQSANYLHPCVHQARRIFLCANWLTAHAMLPNGGLWPFAILIMAGVMIATTVALFFSTFCNPYLATALTGLLFCLPGFWHRHLHAWVTYYPGFPVILQFFSFRFEADWAPRWEVVFAAMFDSAIFWTLAVLVFDRKDLAIPVE